MFPKYNTSFKRTIQNEKFNLLNSETLGRVGEINNSVKAFYLWAEIMIALSKLPMDIQLLTSYQPFHKELAEAFKRKKKSIVWDDTASYTQTKLYFVLIASLIFFFLI